MQIRLQNGKAVHIDRQDEQLVLPHSWRYLKAGRSEYAITHIGGKTVYMHRLIMGAQLGQEVDHINRNGLDNRRSNLRFCTSSQNKMNQKVRCDNKSGHRGITLDNQTGKWRARIKLNGREISLGRHTNIEEAVKARAAATLTYFGGFATLASE